MVNNPFSKVARTMFIITWLIVFLLFFFLFNQWETRNQSSKTLSHTGLNQVTIEGDKRGHYRFDGIINGLTVKFMIDTGASDVAIPEGLANQLKLIKYYPVQLKTANGQAQGYLTRLQSLKIGPIQLSNVRAVVMPGDGSETVLLGMNVLSDLEMMQKDNRLTIRQR